MNRALLMGILVFLCVVGISLVGNQPQAVAGNGHFGGYGCGGCYGYDGCYGGGWGGCYGGYIGGCYGGYSGGCYGGWGRPWLFHHNWRRAGCWGGSYGCFGYSAASYGCYGYTGCGGYVGCGGYTGCGGYVSSINADSCCGSFSGTAVQKGEVAPSTTAEPQVAPKQEASPQVPIPPQPKIAPPQAKPGTTTAAPTGNSAMLHIRVPENAKVVINNHVTTSTGPERRYISRGLTPGLTYRFEVRAEVLQEGVAVSRSKTLLLKADESGDVDFDFGQAQVASLNR